MNFLSDNAAPVAPAVLDAIVQANEGFTSAYGLDDLDVRTLMLSSAETDADSQRIFAAYLDRRQPHWRERVTRENHEANHHVAPHAGKITENEVDQILGRPKRVRWSPTR